MGNPLMRAEIANAVTAGLNEVFWNSAATVPAQYEKVLGSETMDGQYYKALPFYGFGQVPKSSEAKILTYDSPGEGYEATVESDIYKLGCRISREAYDDERYGMLKKVPSELAKSFGYTKNVIAFNILNNGFSDSFVFADGEPLFGDGTTYTHPLKNGGTDSNRPTSAGVDLNAESLKNAMIDLKRTLDDRGNLWDIGILSEGITIGIPLELQDIAFGLVNSDLDPESAKNTANWLKSQKISIEVLDFVTDPDAWFLFAGKNKHRVKVFTRIVLDTDSDREFSTGCLLYSGYERYVAYAEDWRGVWGSPGA